MTLKNILLVMLLCWSGAARSADWVLVSSDETARTYLDASSVSRGASGETRFSLKLAYNNRRDMMSLEYNGALKNVVIACSSGMVLYRQQFLLNDDEVVWTFPESSKPDKADKELPEAIIRKVCG